jgi:hypothetical protein
MNIAHIKRMREMIVENGDTNSQGGPGCSVISEWLWWTYGWEMRIGEFYQEEDILLGGHVWNVLENGTIIDASVDQFAENVSGWPGFPWMAIIPPNHPFAVHYESGGELENMM